MRSQTSVAPCARGSTTYGSVSVPVVNVCVLTLHVQHLLLQLKFQRVCCMVEAVNPSCLFVLPKILWEPNIIDTRMTGLTVWHTLFFRFLVHFYPLSVCKFVWHICFFALRFEGHNLHKSKIRLILIKLISRKWKSFQVFFGQNEKCLWFKKVKVFCFSWLHIIEDWITLSFGLLVGQN